MEELVPIFYSFTTSAKSNSSNPPVHSFKISVSIKKKLKKTKKDFLWEGWKMLSPPTPYQSKENKDKDDVALNIECLSMCSLIYSNNGPHCITSLHIFNPPYSSSIDSFRYSFVGSSAESTKNSKDGP